MFKYYLSFSAKFWGVQKMYTPYLFSSSAAWYRLKIWRLIASNSVIVNSPLLSSILISLYSKRQIKQCIEK